MRNVRNKQRRYGGSKNLNLHQKLDIMLKIVGFFWLSVGVILFISSICKASEMEGSLLNSLTQDDVLLDLKLQVLASGVLWLLAGLSVFFVCDIVSFNIENDNNCDSQIRDQCNEIAEIKQELEKLKNMKKNDEGKSQDYEIEE